MGLWFAALLVIVVVVWIWRRLGKTPQPESSFSVLFNDQQIWVSAPNGERQSVAWDQLTRVGIRTTADGPWRADVFWVLHSEEGHPAVVYPGGSTGETELLEAFQERLPDFRNEALIEAMGYTSKAHFVVWERSL